MKWEVGHEVTDNAASTIGVGTGTTADGWGLILQRWRVEPGLHVVTQGTARRLNCESASTAGYWAIIEHDPATSVYTVLARQAITLTATASTVADTYPLNMPVQVGNTEVYMAWCVHRLASVATVQSDQPAVRGYVAGGVYGAPTDTNTLLRVELEDATYGGDLPSGWDTDDAAAYSTSPQAATALSMQWTSTNGKIADGGAYSGTTRGLCLPRPVDGRAFLLLRDVVAAAGESLSLDGRADTSAAAVNTSRTETLLQGADTYDLAVSLEPDDGGLRVYYLNRKAGMGGQDTDGSNGYLDLTTIGHEPARLGLRNQLLAMDAPRTLVLSGAATVGSIVVVEASALFVVLGDEQVSTKASASAAAVLARLGSAIGSLADGAMWNAAVQGSAMDRTVAGTATAGKTRYNGTVGTHDLIEMVTEGGATLVLAGIGVHDVIDGVTDAETAAAVPAGISAAIQAILGDIGRGRAILLGLPTYNDAAATRHQAAAVRGINTHLRSLAQAYGCAYMAFYRLVADDARFDDGVTPWRAGLSDDQSRYNTVGAAVAAIQFDRAQAGVYDDGADRSPDQGNPAAPYTPDAIQTVNTPNL